MSLFESLPVELVADVLGELDIASLITVCFVSRRFRAIASDNSVNPWRKPILRALRGGGETYEPSLRHLSVRSTVPRQNWVEILSLARPEYLLFQSTLPNLREVEWEECFRRRFLPGWIKWKRDEDSWKTAFLMLLHRVWHRMHSSCTADEAWTKFILLNRNGSANELEATSRGFSPVNVYHEYKLQNNLAHLETRIRLVVQFADVRILAFGVLSKPRSVFSINRNARAFLHPPGVAKYDDTESVVALPTASGSQESLASLPIEEPVAHGSTPAHPLNISDAYRTLAHPLPSVCHANYPLYTPGGADKRWIGSGDLEENGMQWIGPMLLAAQLVGTGTEEHVTESPPLQDLDLVFGRDRNQYASLTWADLAVIAPWLDIAHKIDGPGLGH